MSGGGGRRCWIRLCYNSARLQNCHLQITLCLFIILKIIPSSDLKYLMYNFYSFCILFYNSRFHFEKMNLLSIKILCMKLHKLINYSTPTTGFTSSFPYKTASFDGYIHDLTVLYHLLSCSIPGLSSRRHP
jgi:hypothetical protein